MNENPYEGNKSFSKEEIVKRLLKHAGYYWYEADESSPQSIQQDTFDPAIDKIFKANAFELNKIYQEIEKSRKEVIKELAQLLFPDKFLLPEPAFTVGQINPRFPRIKIEPTDSFEIAGFDDQGNKQKLYFTSLFHHEYPKAEMVYNFTEGSALDMTTQPSLKISPHPFHEKNYLTTKYLWIGLDLPKLEKGDQIIFFLGNKPLDEFDKDYKIFHAASWSLHGPEKIQLSPRIGLEHFLQTKTNTGSNNILENLQIPHNYERLIVDHFKSSFITLSGLPPKLEAFKMPLPPGLKSSIEFERPLIWLRLDFQVAMPSSFFEKFPLNVNCIPMVNRRLKKGNASRSNYDLIPVNLPTEHQFLGMHRITDDGKDKSPYRPIKDVFESTTAPGTYQLRNAVRIRRMNQMDATAEINKLINLVTEEYTSFKERGIDERSIADFQIIEKAINRIRKRSRSVNQKYQEVHEYYALTHIRRRAFYLYYEYWECQPDIRKNIANRQGFKITTDILNIDSSSTVFPIHVGKHFQESEDYFNTLKASVLSRNKIITKGDIEIFVQNRYRNEVKIKEIRSKIVPSPSRLEHLERVILVEIVTLDAKTEGEQELIRLSLQNELNSISSFFTPIQVTIIS